MGYAIIVLSFVVLLRRIERGKSSLFIVKLLTACIWFILSTMMRHSYRWQESQEWQISYTLYFLLSASALYYASHIILMQWAHPWQKRLNKPMLRTLLFIFY